MENEADKKFTWVIKNLSSLQSPQIYSDILVLGRCKWRLLTYPKGYSGNNCLSLFLNVADSKSLPYGWRRRTKFRVHVINQFSEERSKLKEREMLFNQKTPALGISRMLPLTELHAKGGGFLANGEVKIVAEVDVLQVIGGFDVAEEAENSTQPLMKKMKLNVSSDLLNETNQLNSVDVNGFQIFPSQVESVRRIFEKYPDCASKFRSKNQHLKSTYICVLLGLIKTLCQFPQEISDDVLDEASDAVSYVAKGGFKVDWLEKKLEEVKEKNKKVDTGKARLQQMEEQMQQLNQLSLKLKAALMEEENADLSASNVALSFDDVV